MCVEFLKKVPWRYRREIRLDSPERRVAPWAWFWDTRPTSSWRPRSVRPSGCCQAPPRSTRSPAKSGLPRRRRCRVALCGMKVCPKKCLIETYNLVIVLCETRLLEQILIFKEQQILFRLLPIANSQVITGLLPTNKDIRNLLHFTCLVHFFPLYFPFFISCVFGKK